jgi:hypothetical protein
MASGPQHYKDAEDAVEFAAQCVEGSERSRFHLQVALVHATLANAAAIALNDRENNRGHRDEWDEVCAVGTAGAGEGTCPGGCRQPADVA